MIEDPTAPAENDLRVPADLHEEAEPRVQDAITEYWDHRAPVYDACQRRPERWDLDRAAWAGIWRSALPDPPATVLDLGTGSGHVALLLAGMGHRVVGTDLSEDMLRLAAQHAEHMADPPRFERADAVSPGFPDETFDVITNRYLMWTLRAPQQALGAWWRILRPGGLLVVVDAPWFPRGIEASSVEGFSAHYDESVRGALPLAEARSINETARHIRRAGFRDVTVEPLTSILELDRGIGTAPGHDVQLQYAVTARR